MRVVLACFLLFFMSSCTRYYLCVTEEPIAVFSDPALLKYNYVMPRKSEIIVTEKPGHYYLIRNGNGTGYIKKRKFSTRVRYLKSQATAFQFKHPSNVTNEPRKPSLTAGSPRENSIIRAYTPGKTVNVRGYYRKNGTYVRPHTRSAPKRR